MPAYMTMNILANETKLAVLSVTQPTQPAMNDGASILFAAAAYSNLLLGIYTQN